MRHSKTDNPQLQDLIKQLRKTGRMNNADVWNRIAESLSKPRQRLASINISRLNRYTSKRDVVAVAGKVLGAGSLSHPITVAAFAFSAKAREKIVTAKGKCLTLPEILERNPSGSKVKILR
jgi:large subunit ribosomal protein L18e